MQTLRLREQRKGEGPSGCLRLSPFYPERRLLRPLPGRSGFRASVRPVEWQPALRPASGLAPAGGGPRRGGSTLTQKKSCAVALRAGRGARGAGRGARGAGRGGRAGGGRRGGAGGAGGRARRGGRVRWGAGWTNWRPTRCSTWTGARSSCSCTSGRRTAPGAAARACACPIRCGSSSRARPARLRSLPAPDPPPPPRCSRASPPARGRGKPSCQHWPLGRRLGPLRGSGLPRRQASGAHHTERR